MSTHLTSDIDGIPLSDHAWTRLAQRGIGRDAVRAVIDHGREVYTRGARIFVIGHKEVAAARRRGVDVARFEGIHAVCSRDDVVITVYRNRHLQLRAGRKCSFDRRHRMAG